MGVPLTTGGVPVAVADYPRLHLIVATACVGEGAVDGDSRHLGVVRVGFIGLEEWRHTDADYEHTL